MQVVAFIDATSFPTSVTGTEPSLIRYYVNAFSNGVTSDTITFLTNTFRLAENEVEDNIAFSGGSTDIASGINDLTDIFEFVNRTDDRAGLAIVVTDGRASRSEAEAAADALRAEGVTVAAVGFGDEVDLATLEAVASVGRDGTKLVFTAFVFEDIAGLFAAALQRVGAPKLRPVLLRCMWCLQSCTNLDACREARKMHHVTLWHSLFTFAVKLEFPDTADWVLISGSEMLTSHGLAVASESCHAPGLMLKRVPAWAAAC